MAPVALGVGVQNYTCSLSNNFTSTGAVAAMFDASCIYQDTLVPEFAFGIWDAQSSDVASDQLGLKFPNETLFGPLLGHHFFVTLDDANHTLSPTWDFSESQMNMGAAIETRKNQTLPAPNPHTDVAWLQVKGVQGMLAVRLNVDIERKYTH
jgi:hypothetical protein